MNLTVREALLTFRRWPALSALSVTTIAFALFVLGLFALVLVNLRVALADVEERVEIVMYLTAGTPVEVATVAIEDIRSFPEIANVEFVTEQDALAQARQELVEFQDLFGDLDHNPLPASLEISLLPGFRNTASVRDVADRLRSFAFAEDIRFGQDWVEKLDRVRGIGAIVGMLIGGAFVLASIIIIGTTIRMSVLQRAREISIMRLVGATDAFIRRPFLVEGCLKGGLGGVCAVLLNYGAFFTVDRWVLDASFFTPIQALSVIVLGLLLGFGASAMSVGRHLRRV